MDEAQHFLELPGRNRDAVAVARRFCVDTVGKSTANEQDLRGCALTILAQHCINSSVSMSPSFCRRYVSLKIGFMGELRSVLWEVGRDDMSNTARAWCENVVGGAPADLVLCSSWVEEEMLLALWKRYVEQQTTWQAARHRWRVGVLAEAYRRRIAKGEGDQDQAASSDSYGSIGRGGSYDISSRNLHPTAQETRTMQRFVVLSTQRSGSNWVSQRLHLHPEVVMHGEVEGLVRRFGASLESSASESSSSTFELSYCVSR